MAKQISIIGGGIAGLVLGQCLRKRQIPAIIWEKSKRFPSTSQQNFGITLQPEVYHSIVQHLDLEEASFIQNNAIKLKKQPEPGSPIRVNRSALLRTLSKDLDIRWEHKLINISKDSDGRQKLSFENDRSHICDLIVVADGVHSASRSSLKLDPEAFKLEVLPYVVFNGKRCFSLDQLPQGLADCLDTARGLSHSAGGVLLQITSGYIDDDKREAGLNYTLSRPAAAEDERLLSRSNADAESLARQFLEETARLPELPEPFRTVFDPSTMKDDRLLHWLMRSALIAKSTAHELAQDGVVILGDAASPQPILGGAGANSAIVDALKIGKAISESGVNVEVYDGLHAEWTRWKKGAEQTLSKMHQPSTKASI